MAGRESQAAGNTGFGTRNSPGPWGSFTTHSPRRSHTHAPCCTGTFAARAWTWTDRPEKGAPNNKACMIAQLACTCQQAPGSTQAHACACPGTGPGAPSRVLHTHTHTVLCGGGALLPPPPKICPCTPLGRARGCPGAAQPSPPRVRGQEATPSRPHRRFAFPLGGRGKPLPHPQGLQGTPAIPAAAVGPCRGCVSPMTSSAETPPRPRPSTRNGAERLRDAVAAPQTAPEAAGPGPEGTSLLGGRSRVAPPRSCPQGLHRPQSPGGPTAGGNGVWVGVSKHRGGPSSQAKGPAWHSSRGAA